MVNGRPPRKSDYLETERPAPAPTPEAHARHVREEILQLRQMIDIELDPGSDLSVRLKKLFDEIVVAG